MKSIRKIFVCTCFIFLHALSAYSQSSFFDNYVRQMWNTFDNLKGTTATDIIQSSDGYINIGTYAGLVRFDGVEFTTLRKESDNDYEFSSVRIMLEDSNENLWLGSNDEGLQKIGADGVNKSYTTKNGLPNNSIRALVEDQTGNIWVGTAAGVVYITPEGRIINPQFEPGSVPKGVIAVSLYCDSQNRIWLITSNEEGLFLYKNGLFTRRPEFEEYDNYFASTICEDKSGDLWVGLSEQGLIKISNGKVIKVHTNTMLDSVPAWASHVTKDGTIWFGCEKGLVVYHNGTFYEYDESDSVQKINKIISDREGNIWLATDRNGVGKLTHGKFRMTKLMSSVNAIAQDNENKIWIGTDDGLLCFDNDVPVENEITEITKGIRIRHVGIAQNGDVLVSCYTEPGQLRYGKDGLQSWTTEDGLSGNKVRVAIETEPGELYVGTTTGLSVIHSNGKITSFRQTEGLENEYIMCIYKDTNGVIWVGSDGGGIYLFKDEKMIGHIDTDTGLAGNIIFKIMQDNNNDYWISTGSGITWSPAYFSTSDAPVPHVFRSISSESGINSDSVFQLVPDHDDNMWVISNYGVASMPFSELTDYVNGKIKFMDVKYYSKSDGLDSDGPTSTAVSMCDNQGRMWFTMVDGVAVYDANKQTEELVMPLVCIESIKVDNKEYKDHIGDIILPPGTKRLEIKYTGLSFDAPERIQFIHRLSNFEDEFSSPSTSRTVSYTNLKPGRHIFTVYAINGENIMSEESESSLFVQKPYLYQIPAFWIAIAVLVLSGIFLVFYLKQRAMARENIRLEKMVNKRTAELAHEKEKSDQLLRAILPEKIAGQLKDNVHSVGENFADVTILFSDIVSFTKTSSGHSAEEIVLSLNDLFSRFDIRAKEMGVEKIKTIGDAYMAACGLPTKNPDHARLMVEFAKGMFEDLKAYNETARIPFNMRIGLNCGPVNAGVIGKTKFQYDVWGNTVNVASRMESNANPGRIRVSESVYEHLKDSDVKFSEGIECDVKGKGHMVTYEIEF
ncbi:MAG: hypothetical protein J6Y69_06385 [Treponema sp.]|nr:hypothetical protein [Treponema sp.]